MSLNKLTVWMLAATSIAFSSCIDDNFNGGKNEYATLNFSLAANKSISVGTMTRADGDTETIAMADALGVETFTQPEAGNFTIKITDAEGNTKYDGLLSAYSSETTKLPISNDKYKVTATLAGALGFYGEAETETGAPAYYGESEFSITSDVIINVEIPVALSNSILKFEYTSSSETEDETDAETNLFQDYFSDCDITVKDAAQNEVAYSNFEERGAFLEAGKQTIAYTLTVAQAQSAASKTITGSVDVTLKANTCHIFKFNVTNVGGVNKLEIVIDDTIAETHDIAVGDIDINDDNYIQKDENGNGENA